MIIAHWELILVKNIYILRKCVSWYFTTVAIFSKKVENCECVTATRFLSQLSQTFSPQLRLILTVVANLLWNIAIFVTVWSMIAQTFFWMLTANYIVGLNERSTNESTHPD